MGTLSGYIHFNLNKGDVMKKYVVIFLILLSIIVLLGQTVFANPVIYWTDRESEGGEARIHRFNNGIVQDLVVYPIVLTPAEIALDVSAGKMYWVDYSTRQINRANLDGSLVEMLYEPESGHSLWGLALDITGGKMYWTEPSNISTINGYSIRRANLDGTGGEDLITTGLIEPNGIALNLAEGKMYWAERISSAGLIRRANLDGSDMEDLVTDLGAPSGIVLDLEEGQMYWTEITGDRIVRANLDGSDVEPIIERTGSPGEPQNPIGIALDLEKAKVYWTDGDTGKIQRANLDGSEIEDVLIDLPNPIGIALDLTITRVLTISINIYPKILNLKSKGKRIISGIKLPEEYDPHDLARDSFELSIPSCSYCEVIYPTCGFPLWKRYLAFFPRQNLIDEIETINLDLPTNMDLKITGELNDGTPFEGIDTIRVIKRKKWTKIK